MIVIAAILRTIDGKGDEFENEFKKLAPKVRKDPGAITYILNKSTKNPNKYFVYEKYENQEAIKYHGSTPHFQEFSKAIAPLLSEKAEIELYDEIA